MYIKSIKTETSVKWLRFSFQQSGGRSVVGVYVCTIFRRIFWMGKMKDKHSLCLSICVINLSISIDWWKYNFENQIQPTSYGFIYIPIADWGCEIIAYVWHHVCVLCESIYRNLCCHIFSFWLNEDNCLYLILYFDSTPSTHKDTPHI